MRVLVADDHPEVRRTLSALIAATPDLVVVGEADDATSVVQSTRALHPDVVVLDVQMPGATALATVAALVAFDPAVTIVAVSCHDDVALVEALLRAGASAYVLKDRAATDLIPSVRCAGRGGLYVSPALLPGRGTLRVAGT